MQRRFVAGLVYFDLFIARPKAGNAQAVCDGEGQLGVFDELIKPWLRASS